MKRRSPAEVAHRLERYGRLIERYHRTLDLMSPAGVRNLDRHFAQAVRYADLLEVLSPAPTRLIDVGSGVGLPGVVLAASFSGLEIELVERRRKRATFLRMAVAAVAPDGTDGRVTVHEGDVREVGGEPADVIVAQAVAELGQVLEWTRHRQAPTFVVVARKGPAWQDEVAAVAAATGAACDVLAAWPLEQRGTLIAVRTQRGRGRATEGGDGCRSSG
ncbi:MAG: RsmG family class I SAM-dependent methyltransferase [Trueperaceae bacterium]